MRHHENKNPRHGVDFISFLVLFYTHLYAHFDKKQLFSAISD